MFNDRVDTCGIVSAGDLSDSRFPTLNLKQKPDVYWKLLKSKNDKYIDIVCLM